MEVVQGKSTNKKIVIAQEIAFAKVLAGNNKTLRDRAVRKLRKWLTVRGNGKWIFTEEEFIRIWTGLFYCMWMSDKFLVQEELAESISHLIHCFKKNSDTALLFIKCFNKRILMEWEGLDQYRIDKFNMLARRFLRQTFVYCREKDWDESLISKLTGLFFNVVLHRDNSLGFVLHFISIYAEELAKVSKGKLETKTVLKLVEPFVKLIARTKEDRIQREAVDFFNYLMRQTDTGLEFEEKFNAWKEHGFPGSGPERMKKFPVSTENGVSEENGDDSLSERDEDEDEPLDPRAGSVHVFLPQIPIDVDGLLELFKKHEQSKQAHARGKRALRSLSERFAAVKRGKFPARIKKDPILDEKPKKKRAAKKAKELLRFTQSLDEGPIRTKEFEDMEKELAEQDEEADEGEEINRNESEGTEGELSDSEIEDEEEEQPKPKKEAKKKKNKKLEANPPIAKQKGLNGVNQSKQNGDLEHKENEGKPKKTKKKKRKKENQEETASEEESVKPKKRKSSLNGFKVEEDSDSGKETGPKRKILSNWQVQEMDTSSPDYYKIETPKIIRIERKIEESCDCDCEENEEPQEEGDEGDSEWGSEEPERREILPAFWEKAKAKVNKKSPKKGKVFLNPFADANGDLKSPSMRRISFALEKNMAQENEEYLKEVKNSPTVPFDGTKKPVQSALKSGLSPSPVNPFYRFKRIKF